MRPTIEAAGMVLLTKTQPRKVLLLKHARRWDLPKGHVEAGEELVPAALRETEEETGIPASAIEVDPDFQWTIEYDVQTQKRGNYHKRVTYFLGWVDRVLPVRLTEHLGYQWMDWPIGPIQSQTIDPLFESLRAYLERLSRD